MNKTMIIEGMMCAHCTGRVEKALAAVDGVSAVEMSLEGKSAALTLSKDVIWARSTIRFAFFKMDWAAII